MIKQFLNSTARLMIILALFVLLVVLNFYMWRKDLQQESAIRDLQQEMLMQRQENNEIAKVNADLSQKITSLKRGRNEMIEEEARHGFGMVGQGETYYHIDASKMPKNALKKAVKQ